MHRGRISGRRLTVTSAAAKLRNFPRLVLPHLAIALAAACAFDADDRCGAHQSFNDVLNVCECDSGYALDGEECVRCGDNEVPADGQCVCEPGFVRSEEGDCEPAGGDLSMECEPESSDCAGEYSFCALAPAGDGYCTAADCESSDDCPDGFTCTTWEASPFCMRPPTGLGDECDSHEDCEGNDASFCESLLNRACVVAGCDLELEDCSDGFECCDISAFGVEDTLCVPEGRCP